MDILILYYALGPVWNNNLSVYQIIFKWIQVAFLIWSGKTIS